MVDIISWPHCVLTPQQISANVSAYSRSGGRSLGGVERSVRTDLGFWAIDYLNVVMRNRNKDQWRTWQGVRAKLAGRSGLVAVPIRSEISAPYVSGSYEARSEVLHSDGSAFDDGEPYLQNAISIVTEGVTPIGATVISLRIINAEKALSGVRFSYNHALYETGPVLSIEDEVWTVSIWPAVRELIPAGSDLEFDKPTCLCRLAEDRGMDIQFDAIRRHAYPSVSFVEATDYWNDLALGLA